MDSAFLAVAAAGLGIAFPLPFPEEATSSMSFIAMGAAMMGAGGGGGASAKLVSDWGTTAITSLPSTKTGRPGITGVSSCVCKAKGASAMTVRRVLR